MQSQIQIKAKTLKHKLNSFLNCAFLFFFSHLMQISYNSRMDIDREDSELSIGKLNMFLKDNNRILRKILEEKEIEEDPMEDKDSAQSSQERSANIKRKNTKYHSNIIVQTDMVKKSSLRRQKSGSLLVKNLQISTGILFFNYFNLY